MRLERQGVCRSWASLKSTRKQTNKNDTNMKFMGGKKKKKRKKAESSYIMASVLELSKIGNQTAQL